MKLLRAFDWGGERFNRPICKAPIDRIFDEVAKRDNGSLSLKSFYNFRALSFRRQEEIISNLICAFNFADKESAHVDFEENSKKLRSLIEILNSEEELEKKIKEHEEREERYRNEINPRKMLFEKDEDKNYIGKRAKHFKELYEKRPEDETEPNEDKKEISVKKEFDLNKIWNELEESSKDNNLLDEFELEEIKEDKETSNNFTPIKDDIEEFKPEVVKENEKIITDLKPVKFDLPDFEFKFDKEDN